VATLPRAGRTRSGARSGLHRRGSALRSVGSALLEVGPTLQVGATLDINTTLEARSILTL
jgi:hypothetical protein